MTSLLVGLQGANVPLPIRINIIIVAERIVPPTKTNTSPTAKIISTRRLSLFSMRIGTTTSAVTGSTNEEICFKRFFIDPFRSVNLRLTSPQSTHHRTRCIRLSEVLNEYNLSRQTALKLCRTKRWSVVVSVVMRSPNSLIE